MPYQLAALDVISEHRRSEDCGSYDDKNGKNGDHLLHR